MSKKADERRQPRAIDLAIAAMDIDAEIIPSARVAIEQNIVVFQKIAEQTANWCSRKETRDEVRALAAAVRRLASASYPARLIFEMFLETWGMRAKDLPSLVHDLDNFADGIVVPKPAKGARGPTPDSKQHAVEAAANVIRHVLPDLRKMDNDTLVVKFRPNKFKALSEAMFEAITESGADCVGQLDHQIRQYRKGKFGT